MNLKRFWYTHVLKKTPATMEMVSYWKTGEVAPAKLTKNKDGINVLRVEGEKYDIPSYPRGRLLFGPLSKLKHEIKNQVFNEAHALLEASKSTDEVNRHIKQKLLSQGLLELVEGMRYEMLPTDQLTTPVREIHRAWTKVAPPKTYPIRDMLCLILQEDDSYRFRVQWLVPYMGWFLKWTPVEALDKALAILEHGEVIDDMKERQRLLRRIVMTALQDPVIKDLFIKLVREIDWKKVRLSKGDKYHFRGKYFKVDYDIFEY